MSALAFILGTAGFLLWSAGAAAGLARKRWDLFWALCALSNGLYTAAACLTASWAWAAFSAACTAASIWYWDQERRKRGRRRAAELLGAKSRALRDALVRRAREAATPRPVLQPAPGGTR